MDAGLAYRTKGLCDVEQRGRERGKGRKARGSGGGLGRRCGTVGRVRGRSLFYTILLYNSCLPESY
jgi:hypothetical protein